MATIEHGILDAARRGDPAARAQLLRELQDPLYRVCLGLLGHQEMAHEATQETAMRFLRDLGRFKGQSQLRTWAIGIALNVVREMRRCRPSLRGEDFARPLAPRPDEQADLAEQQQLLHALLKNLPSRQREALILRYFEGLSVSEAAAAMQCASGTFKVTVHQALRALRRRLTPASAGHHTRKNQNAKA